MPREAPIRIWRRTNWPAAVWRWRGTDGNPLPLDDSYALTIVWPGQSVPLVFTSGTGGGLELDADARTVTWAYTIEQSAGLPLGDATRYELMGTAAGRTQLRAGGRVVVGSFRP